MHISTVYLSTYSQDRPINGHMEVTDDSSRLKIDFNEVEAIAIQEICSAALQRTRAKMASALLDADIMPPALPAPSKIEDAEYDEVGF